MSHAAQLQEMGFSAEKSIEALRICGGNLEQAIAHLFDEPPQSIPVSNPADIPNNLFSHVVTSYPLSDSESERSLTCRLESWALVRPSSNLGALIATRAAQSGVVAGMIAVVASIPRLRSAILGLDFSLSSLSDLSNDHRISTFKDELIRATAFMTPLSVRAWMSIDSLAACLSKEAMLINSDEEFEELISTIVEDIIRSFDGLDGAGSRLDSPTVSSPASSTCHSNTKTGPVEYSGGPANSADNLEQTAINETGRTSADSMSSSSVLDQAVAPADDPTADSSTSTSPPSSNLHLVHPVVDLLSSTARSDVENISRDIYVLPVSLEQRCESVQQSLASLFWGDEDQRGSLALTRVAQVICIEYSLDSDIILPPFTRNDQTIYPAVFDTRLASIVGEMHSNRLDIENQRQTIARKIMELSSFEGKRVRTVLADCVEYLTKENSLIATNLATVHSNVESKLAELSQTLTSLEQLASDSDPGIHQNVERVCRENGLECPRPYFLVGAILSGIKYCYRGEGNAWTHVELIADSSGRTIDYSVALVSVDELFQIFNAATQGIDGQMLLVYASEDAMSSAGDVSASVREFLEKDNQMVQEADSSENDNDSEIDNDSESEYSSELANAIEKPIGTQGSSDTENISPFRDDTSKLEITDEDIPPNTNAQDAMKNGDP